MLEKSGKQGQKKKKRCAIKNEISGGVGAGVGVGMGGVSRMSYNP